MGLLSNMKKRREEKEAAKRTAEMKAVHAAAAAAQSRKLTAERAAAAAAQAKRDASDQKQDLAITEMRSIKEKIELWQKKVTKLQTDKKVVLAKLADAKKRGVRMDEADKRRLAKVNKDIRLTQGQLETLESKLAGIEQAAANVSVVETIDVANEVTDKISKPVAEVQDVLEKAEQQRQDLEDANLEFLMEGSRADYDEDELLEDLKDFEAEQAYEQGVANPAATAAAAAAASAAPAVPTVTPNFPAKAAQTEDDELEAELRRMELQGQAA